MLKYTEFFAQADMNAKLTDLTFTFPGKIRHVIKTQTKTQRYKSLSSTQVTKRGGKALGIQPKTS